MRDLVDTLQQTDRCYCGSQVVDGELKLVACLFHQAAAELDRQSADGNELAWKLEQALISAAETENTLLAEGRIKDAALLTFLNYPGIKKYVGTVIYDNALATVSTRHDSDNEFPEFKKLGTVRGIVGKVRKLEPINWNDDD